ncbi:MAG: penicillin-binding protein 2 [Anaerovoracaceae bacterium]
MVKRAKEIYIILVIILIALVVRLFFIQIIGHEDLSEATKSQYLVNIDGLDTRGVIYDRNMVPLTDNSNQYYYIIPVSKWNVQLDQILCCIDGQKVGQQGSKYYIYRACQFDKDVNKRLISDYNAYGFQCGSRYQDQQVAAHVIGYLNSSEKRGVSGIELMCQNVLRAKDKSLALYADSQGNIMKGIDMSTSSNITKIKANSVVTTLDTVLQSKVEKILAENGISGGVVVMETKTGEILTCASAPEFNPNRVYEHLSENGDELINKATQGLYPPGSIFKIIVTAAALEKDASLINKKYNCTGKTNVNDVDLTCLSGIDGGHGKVHMKEAFAMSCNCYFANLGKEIGSEEIASMAVKCGLGHQVLVGFPEEERGYLPQYQERYFSGISNFSIGQGSLLVTPMQMAQVTNIIANNGLKPQVKIVKAGNDIPADTETPKRVISMETATKIQKMMEEVMISGTGNNAKTDVRTGGKTGSAEATIDGASVVHGWFTGFFPAEDPQYTVTVFVENGSSGRLAAVPVFQEIVNFLY